MRHSLSLRRSARPFDHRVPSMEVPIRVRPEVEALAELNDDAPYFDADFPPVADSLLATKSMAVTQWRRVTEALPGRPLIAEAPQKMACGETIDDMWLANALVVVQSRPALVHNLFASTEYEDRGVLTLRFYKHGGWRPVLIDTMVPCGADGRPSFVVEQPSEGSLWPSLLLKGYAKLHGGYNALDGGDVAEALVDFTGGAATKLAMPETDEDEEVDALWGEMLRAHKRGVLQAQLHLLCCCLVVGAWPRAAPGSWTWREEGRARRGRGA